MSDTTANLGLPVILAGQAQKHVTHNEALRFIDTLLQLSVLDRDLASPPGTPTEGQRWIVAASPTSAWAGHADHIAAWQDGGWQFSAPKTGWVSFVADEGTLVVWNGTAWGDFFSTVTAIQNLARLGIGTTADATNPLSAKLNNALWVAKTVSEGGDGNLRYKLSKESSSNTLSFLLQNNFSGRAEVGLTGDDDLHFKVSPDGSTWYEGLKIDRASGKVAFPVSGGPRELLTASRTYYVRADGSDANNGLANSSVAAFLTIQKAVDTVAGLDINGQTVTVQVGDGTYTGAVVLKNVAGFAAAGNLVIQGNHATPANVVVGVTGASAFSAASLSVVWDILDLKIQTTTSGHGLLLSGGASVRWGNLDFGAVANAHISAASGALATALGDCAISGGAQFHWVASAGASVFCQSRTITLSGTLAYSGAFCQATTSGTLRVNGNTFTGAATGKRYDIGSNGVISTSGASSTYFPGDTVGTSASGGQYI